MGLESGLRAGGAYWQELLSFPGMDARLDRKVKSSDIKALNFTRGLVKVSLEVLMATGNNEAEWEACKGFMNPGHLDGVRPL